MESNEIVDQYPLQATEGVANFPEGFP